ncbi:MAG: divergent polysaccharide deacetylase family protein [Desulfovermiculus sp.]|nr:divergent polysaccharide deacetylase family protein [Desulfovermiculus sp.]
MAAARKKKPSRKEKKAGGSTTKSSLHGLGVRFLIWLTALGLTTLGLIGVLLVPENTTQSSSGSHLSAVQSNPQARTAKSSELTPQGQAGVRVYEQIPPEAPQPAEQAPEKPPSAYEPAPSTDMPAKGGPRMAVVIDDMGQSLGQARKLLDIMGSDLTWSILPFSAKTREVVQLAADNGLEYLLHVPMEPKRYPQVDPGPGGILVDMSSEQIRAVLTNNLDQIPGAAGANNHMGSRFTEDIPGMQIVLQEIKSQGLFFMDSLTSPHSKVKVIAQELHIPVAFRDVFLDNRQDVGAILGQLRKAERLALRMGQAVAIGHPYPETLTALAKWSKERDSDVELVKLSRLVAEIGN